MAFFGERFHSQKICVASCVFLVPSATFLQTREFSHNTVLSNSSDWDYFSKYDIYYFRLWKFCWYFVFSNSLSKMNFLHFVCWKCINHNAAVELSFENHLPSWVHFIWEAYKLSVEKILAQPFSKHQRIWFLFANA